MVVVLFDFEGTLVRSMENDPEAVTRFRTKTKEKLLELGVPSDVLEGETKSTLLRNKAVEYVEEHFSEKEAKRFHAEMDDFLKSYELHWANRSRIFLDAIPTLRMLKKLGYKMGLVTSTSKEAANRMLSKHGISAFFDVVVTREDVKKLKPHPEGILLALNKMNGQDFFFVGDLIYDSLASKNAGGVSIIVNRSTSKKPKFHANYFVKSLKEIPSIVQQLNR